jgi:PAS domain-containing protein
LQVSLRQELNSALYGHVALNLETSMTTKMKGSINLLLHVSQRKDLEGLVTGLIGVGQDITDQKRAEIEKSRIAQELQTFIDTANAPIFGIDSHGLVNEWNNKTAAITGFSREEVLGRDLVEVHYVKWIQL